MASSIPETYRITDTDGEEVEGIFYKEELSKTYDTGVYLIEKVLKSRGKGDKAEIFVKWSGYPDSFNKWISASALLPSEAAR